MLKERMTCKKREKLSTSSVLLQTKDRGKVKMLVINKVATIGKTATSKMTPKLATKLIPSKLLILLKVHLIKLSTLQKHRLTN